MTIRGPVPGGRKVGRKPAFTSDDVVQAAIAEGLDRFTLAAVAERLGVVPPAIYRVFASRDDLVVACLDAAGATIALPASGMSWRDVLRMWADECWQVCEVHPGLSRLVYSYPIAPTRIEHVFTAYVLALATERRSAAQAMFALGIVADTVFASHWSVETMRQVDERGRRGVDAVRDAVGVDTERLIRPEESWTDRTTMDAKVEFILDGLTGSWPALPRDARTRP